MDYRFAGGIALDTDRVELRVAGEAVEVQPQVFDVMTYLVEHADRVITKEELLDNVWGDRFVSESALTSRIKSARQAVGDDGKQQRVIRTVHGRGYRWVADRQAGDAAGEGTLAVESQLRLSPSTNVIALEPAARGARLDDPWPTMGRHRELSLLAARLQDPATGGFILTGPPGIGKTRFLTEAVEIAERAGLPIAKLQGHAQGKKVPLAALAHLMPASDHLIFGPDEELTRGVLFQRAKAAVESQMSAGRLVLAIDDIDQVDDLSVAVVRSLIAAGSVFVLATQRLSPTSKTTEIHLAAEHGIERIELEPLDEELLGVGLYRALGDPIDPQCLRQLLDAADGSPGVLRELVEASIGGGEMKRVDGVWRLVGTIVPSGDLVELVERRLVDLEPEQRAGAELLAVAGEVGLDSATELVGEEHLDALDLCGLVDLRRVQGELRVALMHPLYGEVLRSGIKPLRERRLKRTLLDALEGHEVTVGDRLRHTRWRIDEGDDVDADRLLETARLAVLQRDYEGARGLIDRLHREAPSALVTQLDAELHFRQGHASRVETLLASIDLSELDDVARAQVARRRTTTMFFASGDNETPLAFLQAEMAAVAEGPARMALRSQEITLRMMSSPLGPVHDEAVGLINEATGVSRLELMRSIAYARYGRGRHADALDMVVQSNEHAATLVPSLGRPSLGLAQLSELGSLVELGERDSAESRAAEMGVPNTFGWLTIVMGAFALMRGRPRLTIERLANPIGIAKAVGQQAMVAWMQSLQAEAYLRLGDLETARSLKAEAEPAIEDRNRMVDIDMIFRLAPVIAATDGPDVAVERTLEAARRSARLDGDCNVLIGLQAAAQLGGAAEAHALIGELDPHVEGRVAAARVLDIEGRARGDLELMTRAAAEFEACDMVLLAALSHRDRLEYLDGVDAAATEAAIWRLTNEVGSELVV